MLGAVALYVIVPAIAQSQKPDVVHNIDRLNTKVDNDNKAVTAANNDLNAAKKTNNAAADRRRGRKRSTRPRSNRPPTTTRSTKEQNKLTPLNFTVLGVVLRRGRACT